MPKAVDAFLPHKHKPDERKHAAPELENRERNARWEEWLGVAAGVLMIVAGIASMIIWRPYHWWPVMLVMLGPIMIFLSFMGFFTFMERVEEDRYFPDAYKRKEFERTERGYHPGAWNP